MLLFMRSVSYLIGLHEPTKIETVPQRHPCRGKDKGSTNDGSGREILSICLLRHVATMQPCGGQATSDAACREGQGASRTA